jgi:putative hydrolase of HD superfamily
MADNRLEAQLRFIVEVDRLKSVLRRTWLTDGSRRENSAEHSWHLALMALLLAEHAPPGLDLPHATRILLVHDLVEIDAGDTFAYDADGNADRAAREREAAERLFGLLPPDQARELRALWEEFEAGETAEARFALALDRLQPLLLNVRSQGGAWRAHGVTREQVLDRMQPIATVSAEIWAYVEWAVNEVWAAGWIRTLEEGTGPRDEG